jgi:ESCRT-II complex subunit VPS36
LISPDDLLKAVDCMKSLNLGMSKRIFPSGVIVVQEDSFDDDVMAAKLRELAEEQLSLNSGLTDMEVSKTLHISALLAHEQLLQSEKLGYLCRDETLETTRFYPNLFEEFAIQLKKQSRQ